MLKLRGDSVGRPPSYQIPPASGLMRPFPWPAAAWPARRSCSARSFQGQQTRARTSSAVLPKRNLSRQAVAIDRGAPSRKAGSEFLLGPADVPLSLVPRRATHRPGTGTRQGGHTQQSNPGGGGCRVAGRILDRQLEVEQRSYEVFTTTIRTAAADPLAWLDAPRAPQGESDAIPPVATPPPAGTSTAPLHQLKQVEGIRLWRCAATSKSRNDRFRDHRR